MRFAFAPLLLLAACGAAESDDGGDRQPPVAVAVSRADPVPAKPVIPRSPAASSPVCEASAPESPCQIVGKWRVTRVYNPANRNPLADEMGMTGSTFTITGNSDASGTIRWDGPDNGQFDQSDVCTGPYLSSAAAPRADPSRATLAAAFKAWKVPGDAGAARHLGCDQGHWSVPSDPAGKWFGLVLPMGRQMAFEWFGERIILAERAD